MVFNIDYTTFDKIIKRGGNQGGANKSIELIVKVKG